LRPVFGKEGAGDAPTTQNDEQNGHRLKQEFSERDRYAGEMNESGDPFVKEGCLKLNAEEFRIVRVKCGIQVALYGCEVNAVVFDSGVITHHRHRNEREREDQKDIAPAKFLHLIQPNHSNF